MSIDLQVSEVQTPHGPARVHLRPAASAHGGLVLGHGAGGGVTAPDLIAATSAALDDRVSVALVEQPYRVAGRRSPAPARQLDAAFAAVVADLRAGAFRGLPIVVGGRSSGARVACRTAAAAEAVGVLCLAFPLVPPAKRRQGPEVAAASSRLPELEAVQVPILIVQGERDPFGVPPSASGREVVVIAGDHSLRGEMPALEAAVRGWLSFVFAAVAT